MIGGPSISGLLVKQFSCTHILLDPQALCHAASDPRYQLPIGAKRSFVEMKILVWNVMHWQECVS